MKNGFQTIIGLVLGMALALSAGAAEREPAENGYHRQKVVYQINDAEMADFALRNVRNHIKAVGQGKVEIAVVTYGPGVKMLLDGWKDKEGRSFDGTVQDLANAGVRFMVCNNTLKGNKIEPSKVNMSATIVPSGVATITELQHQGYVYLKP